MARSKTRRPPEVEHKRHRVFGLVILPILALVTLFLIYKAVAG